MRFCMCDTHNGRLGDKPRGGEIRKWADRDILVDARLGYWAGYFLCPDVVQRLLWGRHSGYMIRLGAQAMWTGHRVLAAEAPAC